VAGRKSTDEGLFGVLGSHAATLVVVVLYRRYWFCVWGRVLWLGWARVGMDPGGGMEVVFVFVLAVCGDSQCDEGFKPLILLVHCSGIQLMSLQSINLFD
jgi:hypothetical protein